MNNCSSGLILIKSIHVNNDNEDVSIKKCVMKITRNYYICCVLNYTRGISTKVYLRKKNFYSFKKSLKKRKYNSRLKQKKNKT